MFKGNPALILISLLASACLYFFKGDVLLLLKIHKYKKGSWPTSCLGCQRSVFIAVWPF